MAYYIGMF